MSQPPYGYGSGEPPPDRYPRQELLPQSVKPSRSRLPLIIVAGALAVVLVGVVIGLRVIHDRGENNRAAYCVALKTVIQNGNFIEAIADGSQSPTGTLAKIRNLAPTSVKSDWDVVFSILSSSAGTQPDLGTAGRALIALKAIIDDANANCGAKIQIPF